MSVDIIIQETVNDVDITVNQNVITVNVIRTTGGGGVESVTGTLVDNTDPNNPVINTPNIPTKTSDLTNDGENNTSTFVESNELGAVAFSNNYNDLDNKPTIPSPQNLTQVLTQSDIQPYTIPIPNNTFVTFDLGRELTENYFTTDDVGTGGVFLDKDVVFPDNATIRFQAGYVEDNVTPTNVTLLPYRFTTDAYVFYQGAIVTDITIQPEDVCTLKWGGNNSTDGIQIWFLSIVSTGGGGSGTVTSVSGTTNEITVSSPTTTPVIGISSTYTSARDAYADAKVADNLTASTTVAPSKTAVNTALGLKIDETTWVDYSASSTVVGWSSFTTKKISYKIIDNLMIVDFNLDGTSNSGAASFTIPQNAGGTSFVLSAYIINVGTVSAAPGRINTVSGSNVITIQKDAQNNAFGAGQKRCSGQIFIQL